MALVDAVLRRNSRSRLAAARHEEVQEDKAVKHRERSAVAVRVEPTRLMRHEIGDCHLARQDEGDRAREQAEDQKDAAKSLQDASQSRNQRKQIVGTGLRPRREVEEFVEPVLHKKQPADDPQKAQHSRLPGEPQTYQISQGPLPFSSISFGALRGTG